MKLNEESAKNFEQLKEKGYSLPEFNREEIKKITKKNPLWIHFGAGNIFRAFQANVVQKLLNNNDMDRGLIVAEGYDLEIITKMNRVHDDYNILVTLKENGEVEKTVIGSIVESLIVDPEDDWEYDRLKEIFSSSSLQMVTFTITEKGYELSDSSGKRLSSVQSDLDNGPKKPISYMGKVASLLYERYLKNKKPISLVSMDNCSHNGDKLYEAIKTYAKMWEEKKLVKKGFLDYVSDKRKVSFPLTMIDKITPRPDLDVLEILKDDGLEGMQSIITSKNTYIAPFVNAEETEYLVIEDVFPNGRPELEKAGIIFTDRKTVNKVEKMKVTTCLNPLHTALAIFGCLLDHQLISQEMKDVELKRMVEIIGYDEGLKVVVDPEIIDPKKFIDEVINVRFPNPFMPDTPQRIASDTSQKMAIRFGETIKAYDESPILKPEDLKIIPLVIAGWLRYLMGINDEGKDFELSPDPMLETLCPYLEDISLGDEIDVEKTLYPILSDDNIFGVDLYKVGLGKKIEEYFLEMTKEEGSIRKTLKKYIK